MKARAVQKTADKLTARTRINHILALSPVVFYSFNTDIGDGLEDAEVHNDPPEKHEAALRIGVNIVVYALTH